MLFKGEGLIKLAQSDSFTDVGKHNAKDIFWIYGQIYNVGDVDKILESNDHNAKPKGAHFDMVGWVNGA